MAYIITGRPEDHYQNTTFRWINVWRSLYDNSVWASEELARAWSQDQGGEDATKVEKTTGFMPMGESSSRVFIYENDYWQPWSLGVELEIVNYEDKVRNRARMKLSAEERRVLGIKD